MISSIHVDAKPMSHLYYNIKVIHLNCICPGVLSGHDKYTTNPFSSWDEMFRSEYEELSQNIQLKAGKFSW